MEDETLEPKSSWGGARPGSGHPKGKKTQRVIEREAAKREFQDRVAKHADELFNAQFDIARGEKYLMVKTTSGSGKDRKVSVEVVTDTEVIKQFLDDSLENTDTEYYFISTKPANNLAIDSLLNRSFGKADEKVAIDHSGITTFDETVANEFNEFMKKRTEAT